MSAGAFFGGKMSGTRSASLSVLAAGILWGMISLFVKPLSAAGLGSLQIAAVRMLVASPLFTAFVALRSPALLRVRLRDLWMFAGTGICSVALFNVCYFYTIIHGEASVAVVLLYTSPVFILLLSALFFKDKITARKWIAVALTVAGCVCVAGLQADSLRLPLRVLLTGLGSGLFYGLYTIFGRAALRRYDASTVTAYTFLFGLIATVPFGKPAVLLQSVAEKPSVLLWGVGIGVVCTVLPYYLYTWGLARMDAGKAAIMVAVEPAVGAVIGMTVFRESCGVLKFIGIAAILCAIVLLNVPQKKRFSLDFGRTE